MIIVENSMCKLRVEGDNVRVTYENGQEVNVNKDSVDFSQCQRSFYKFNDNKVKYYTGCKNISTQKAFS
jgi:hypothetical protein